MRANLGIDPDAPVVVCTARFVRRKGQDTLVKAWPRVLDECPSAVLLLVGDGPDRSRIERLVRARRVGDSVVFTGSVPWEDVPAYTDAGDLFAMPCRTRYLGLEPEAWGIVSLEAQACGLRVLIGDSGGAPETVAGTVGGLVVGRSAADVGRAVAAALRMEPVSDSSDVMTGPLWTWDRTGDQFAGLLA